MSTKTKQYKFTCVYDASLELNEVPRNRIVIEEKINKPVYNLLKTLAVVKSHDENRLVLNKIYSRMVNGEPCLIACDGIRLMIVRLSQHPFNSLAFLFPMDRFWEVEFYKDFVYFTDQTRAMSFLGYTQYFGLDNFMMNLDYTDFLIEIDKYHPHRERILSPSIRITQLCASNFNVHYDADMLPLDGLIDSYKDKVLVGVNEEQNNQLHIECESFVFIMIPTQESDYIKVYPDSIKAKSLFFKKPLQKNRLFPDWSLNNASSK